MHMASAPFSHVGGFDAESSYVTLVLYSIMNIWITFYIHTGVSYNGVKSTKQDSMFVVCIYLVQCSF